MSNEVQALCLACRSDQTVRECDTQLISSRRLQMTLCARESDKNALAHIREHSKADPSQSHSFDLFDKAEEVLRCPLLKEDLSSIARFSSIVGHSQDSPLAMCHCLWRILGKRGIFLILHVHREQTPSGFGLYHSSSHKWSKSRGSGDLI